MKKLFIFIFALLSFPVLAAAQCTGGASPNWTWALSANVTSGTNNLQGCINQTVNGDKITISAGTATWTSGVTISSKGITITGTGTPNTGGGTVGAGTPSTTLIDNAGTALFNFTGLTIGQTAKVELLTMSASGAGTNSITAAVIFNGTCTVSGCANIRVDNINFTAGTWGTPCSGGLIIEDNVFGVVDHNTASESTSATAPLVQVSNDAWQGIGLYGDNSFASADTFGTAQAMYLENNSISGLAGTQNDVNIGLAVGGARYVCRFNTFTNASGTGICPGHGTAWGGRFRGQRQVEAYYNTAGKTPGFAWDSMTSLNSGTGYFFSNTYTATGAGANKFVALDIARFVQTGTPWNHCDGTQPWDQVPFTSASACLDQPGSGPGAGLQNTTPVLVSAPGVACTTAGQCWPNPTLDPVYEAGDTFNNGFPTPISVSGDGSQTRVLINRDYYGEVSMSANSSPTSPFNGTTGTGYGTLANRPGCISPTCLTGVGYWCTNCGTWNTFDTRQGTLYVWNGSTWTTKFIPYTWPHPLAGGGNPQAATPAFSPGAGAYPSTQTVTITTASPGAIICYNTTGAPATNGSTGCSAGSSLYAGPVTVSVNETLFAVAGGTGYLDSAVGSAAYFIGVLPPSSLNTILVL
jgi:hypothetical protein